MRFTTAKDELLYWGLILAEKNYNPLFDVWSNWVHNFKLIIVGNHADQSWRVGAFWNKEPSQKSPSIRRISDCLEYCANIALFFQEFGFAFHFLYEAPKECNLPDCYNRYTKVCVSTLSPGWLPRFWRFVTLDFLCNFRRRNPDYCHRGTTRYRWVLPTGVWRHKIQHLKWCVLLWCGKQCAYDAHTWLLLSLSYSVTQAFWHFLKRGMQTIWWIAEYYSALLLPFRFASVGRCMLAGESLLMNVDKHYLHAYLSHQHHFCRGWSHRKGAKISGEISANAGFLCPPMPSWSIFWVSSTTESTQVVTIHWTSKANSKICNVIGYMDGWTCSCIQVCGEWQYIVWCDLQGLNTPSINISTTRSLHRRSFWSTLAPCYISQPNQTLLLYSFIRYTFIYRRSGFNCEYLLNANCEDFKTSQLIDSQK